MDEEVIKKLLNDKCNKEINNIPTFNDDIIKKINEELKKAIKEKEQL